MPRPAQPRPAKPRNRWFDQAAAQALMQAEQRALIPSITGVFGQAGLYLRPNAEAPRELSGNMLLSVLRLHGDGGCYQGDLECEGSRLPLADDSVSLVYALHAFDTCPDVVGMAAEIARVLAPEGVAVVVGLNPWSPWLLRWAGRGPRWQGAGGLRAVLAAQGLDVYRRNGVGPVWPVTAGAAAAGDRDGRDWLARMRAGYALLARKRRSGMTPLPLAPARPALALKPFAPAGRACVHGMEASARARREICRAG